MLSLEGVKRLSKCHFPILQIYHQFINIIQNMVIKNTEIAVRGSIIMNNVIMQSVADDVLLLPTIFCQPTYLKHAFNWTITPSHQQLIQQVVIEHADIFVSNGLSAIEMPIRSWLLGYIYWVNLPDIRVGSSQLSHNWQSLHTTWHYCFSAIAQ